jgi:8-oxo-dGTP diphosphatase
VEIRVAGIMLREGQLLLASHFKNNQLYWVLPGGHVEEGETLETAVIREFQEEACLPVKPKKLVFFHELILPNENRHILNFYFLLEECADQIKPVCDEVLREFRLISLEELPRLDLRPKKILPFLLAGLKEDFPRAPLFLGDLA